MTENEAVKLGKSLRENITSNANNIIPTKEYIEFVGIAIQALEEIQQYRAIGTVEELKSMKENGAFSGVELAQLAAMQMRLKEYSAIGTIEEFNDLKEKSVKKKPVTHKDTRRADCPWCGATVRGIKTPYGDWCSKCGQKLDWQ